MNPTQPQKLAAFLLACALVPQSLFSAPKYIPVASGFFSTGQWYFEGKKSGLGGNAYFNFVPALKFSNRFTVIPSVETNYRGTRSAEELAGGSTLFQDTWENAVSVKAIKGLNERWNLKGRLAGRMKWFRETTDETWNDGLYDYRTFTVGTELERRWMRNASISLGYDFSFMTFPNYVSLESSQDGENAREFAGDNVLDSQLHLASLKLQSPIGWGTQSTFQLFYNPRFYADQHIVQLSGLFSSEKRKDIRTGGTAALEKEFNIKNQARLIPTLSYGYASVNSNQNHYDARLTTFISDFYDYYQHSAGLNLALTFGRSTSGPMVVETGYGFSHRDYRSRVIQAESGSYLSEKLFIEETAFTMAFTYPLSRNFRLRTSSSFGRSVSNNQYEAAYQYNYSNASYQFGFTYDY